MNKRQTLSIVIPTIGRKLLNQTIASVLNQTSPPDEIIVFDNSGTGKVRRESLFSDSQRIIWKISSERKPITESWNTAVSFASMDYVYICGDDDLLYPDFVENIRTRLVQNPGLIYCEPDYIDEAGNHLPDIRHDFDRESYSPPELLKYFFSKLHIYLSSMTFLKKNFDVIGGFHDIINNGLFMDHLFFLENACQTDKIMILPSPCWQHRMDVSDWSGNIQSDKIRNQLPRQYNAYLKTVRELFRRKEISMPDNFEFLVLLFLVRFMIYSPSFSVYKSALVQLCFKTDFPLKCKFYILRHIFYIVRHPSTICS